jgi:hypothetical protein
MARRMIARPKRDRRPPDLIGFGPGRGCTDRYLLPSGYAVAVSREWTNDECAYRVDGGDLLTRFEAWQEVVRLCDEDRESVPPQRKGER